MITSRNAVKKVAIQDDYQSKCVKEGRRVINTKNVRTDPGMAESFLSWSAMASTTASATGERSTMIVEMFSLDLG